MEQRKQSVLGVIAFIFGLLGMLTTWMFVGILPCFVGIILAIVSLCIKNRKRKFAIAGIICSLIGIVIFGLIFYWVNYSDKNTENMNDDAIEELLSTAIPQIEITPQPMLSPAVTEIPTPTPTIEPTKSPEELEREYKDNCTTLWYDEVFFSDENLKGKHVKLELYIEEGKYFKTESIYNSTVVEFVNEYNLQRDLWACGVLREGTDSYVGGQIYLYFSDDYSYDALDFEIGQEIIVYGEIIDYSTNTWDGYNMCGVMPHYIEVK